MDLQPSSTSDHIKLIFLHMCTKPLVMDTEVPGLEVAGQVLSHGLTGLTELGCRGPVVDTEAPIHCVLFLLTFDCPFDSNVLQLEFSPSSNKYPKKCH